jgi:uncharacterized protein
MISIRSILLILFIWFLLWFGRRYLQSLKQNKYNKQNMKQETATREPSKAMVRCKYCGVYLPEEEALSLGENRYCCEAHQKIAQQDH